MSRPAMAAWYRCHTSVLSRSESDANASAYSCTTAASSTVSSRYLRSAVAEVAGVAAAGVPSVRPQAVTTKMANKMDTCRSARMSIAYCQGTGDRRWEVEDNDWLSFPLIPSSEESTGSMFSVDSPPQAPPDPAAAQLLFQAATGYIVSASLYVAVRLEIVERL